MRNKVLINKLPLSIIYSTYFSSTEYIKCGKYRVYTKDDRYLNFIHNGFKCVRCGKEGSYCTLEAGYKRKNTHKGNHFNVYAEDGVLLTKDHIYPKSKGGLDNIKNYQVLCMCCNNNKKDISPLTMVQALKGGYATKESIERAVKLHRPKALLGV